MTRVVRYLCCALGLMGVIAAVSSGADSGRTWTMPRFSDDAAGLYRAVSSITVPAGDDVVVADDETTYTFDADGKSVVTTYLVYKIVTQDGATGWNEVSQKWAPWNDTRPVIRARVITPDNVVHVLDAKAIMDEPAKEKDEDTYSDRRQVRGPLPAIAPGSVVEEEETWTRSPLLPGTGSLGHKYFGRGYTVQNTRLVVDVPISIPIQYNVILLPGLKPERTEKDGRVRLVFDKGVLEPDDDDDDNYWPFDVPEYREVDFTTESAWQRVADAYGKVVDDQIGRSDLKSLADKLIAGKNSREDRVTAIMQYLGREIRYTGVEFGESAIIPHAPAEVLKNKYGDCKDKATLLTALLRAADIPADVALLNAGPDEDLGRELPGIGQFDHAIVHVPGAPELWIDATDKHARLGELPTMDQGRMALIARSDTTSPVLIPESSAQDNLIREKREFFLAESGPARVVETTEPHGDAESSYRDDYEDGDSKDTKKDLTDYVKNQYLAEKLEKINVPDAGDLTKPFQLGLEISGAKRGFTDLDMAVVAIRLESIFSRIPKELKEKKEEESKDAEASKDKAKKARTADYQLPRAFISEWDYKIAPPPGFRPKPVPADAKIAVGPGTLTEEFKAGADGNVNAVIRFELGKSRLTVEEATKMRNKVAELMDAHPIDIYFEPTALGLLNEGKIRESFDAYKSLIAMHPKEGLHHLQMANALLSAGMGQAARDEGQLAVKLDPTSALAEKTLAKILEYDLVGRKMRPGSDFAGAAEAMRAARKLDPSDHEVAGDLAILLEYNRDGERYGTGADLKAAVAAYKELTAEQLANIGLKNNPAFAMVYAGEFAEARKYAEGLNPQLASVIVATESISNGSKAGIAEARKRSENEDGSKQMMVRAGQILMRLRKYQLAADLYEAGAGGSNASNTIALATMLRKAKPVQEIHHADDPVGIAMRSFSDLLTGKMSQDEVTSILSRNAQIVDKETDPEERESALHNRAGLRNQAAKSGLPLDALIDLTLGLIETNAEGDDALGYKVTLRGPGITNLNMFVIKEGGKYRLLDSSQNPNSLALEVLDRVAAGNLAGAERLLSWIREEQHLGGGDDPLAGQVFPRFWTNGKVVNAEQIKLAAAALLAQTAPTAKQGITILEEARDSAKTDADKLNIALALIAGYITVDDFGKLASTSAELAKEYPESKSVFLWQQKGLIGLGKYADADGLAQDWLKRMPNDIEAMRALVASAAAREDYALAHERGLNIVKAGKAETADLNTVAWYALFTGKVSEEDLADISKAAQSAQGDATVLHTLGCVYAELGKTKEAREVLIQAMDILGLDEPDARYWYAFGRIAEQYGERDVAADDYRRAAKPKKAMEIPGSSYRLAQIRLKGLEAGAGH